MGPSAELVLVLVLWAGLGQLDSGVCSLELPDIDNKSFMKECVKEHNAARSSARPSASNMLYMTWDEGLAITARAWARRCEFQHNIYLNDARRVHPDFPSVGENLWIGSTPSSFTVKRAMERWLNEERDYNYLNNTCSKVCGHYTQVVWAGSYKVGCAVQVCPNGIKSSSFQDGAIFVCNYATAGNVVGSRPFQSGGAPCSSCGGNCEQKLCRNNERDAEKRYNWTPDWDSSSTSSSAGSSIFVAIVTIRPVALILTFIAAYTVHYFYPDIFCYE